VLIFFFFPLPPKTSSGRLDLEELQKVLRSPTGFLGNPDAHRLGGGGAVRNRAFKEIRKWFPNAEKSGISYDEFAQFLRALKDSMIKVQVRNRVHLPVCLYFLTRRMQRSHPSNSGFFAETLVFNVRSAKHRENQGIGFFPVAAGKD
jgi:hypothetical protein